MAGKLAKMRILDRDVITFIVWLIAWDSLVKCSSCLYGQEVKVVG